MAVSVFCGNNTVSHCKHFAVESASALISTIADTALILAVSAALSIWQLESCII